MYCFLYGEAIHGQDSSWSVCQILGSNSWPQNLKKKFLLIYILNICESKISQSPKTYGKTWIPIDYFFYLLGIEGLRHIYQTKEEGDLLDNLITCGMVFLMIVFNTFPNHIFW